MNLSTNHVSDENLWLHMHCGLVKESVYGHRPWINYEVKRNCLCSVYPQITNITKCTLHSAISNEQDSKEIRIVTKQTSQELRKLPSYLESQV